MCASLKNSRRQKGEMKQDLYWGPTILECPANFTLSERFLLVACDVIQNSKWKFAAIILMKKLGPALQIALAWVISRQGFKHPWT